MNTNKHKCLNRHPQPLAASRDPPYSSWLNFRYFPFVFIRVHSWACL